VTLRYLCFLLPRKKTCLINKVRLIPNRYDTSYSKDGVEEEEEKRLALIKSSRPAISVSMFLGMETSTHFPRVNTSYVIIPTLQPQPCAWHSCGLTHRGVYAVWRSLGKERLDCDIRSQSPEMMKRELGSGLVVGRT